MFISPWLVAKYVYELMIKDYEKIVEVMDILKVPVPLEKVSIKRY